MKTTFNIKNRIFPLILALCLPACGSSSDDAVTEEDARAAAEDFTGATAEGAEFEAEEGYWEVELELPDGGTVEAEVSESGEVLEVKADEPPFDYDITLVDGTLSLAAATAKALELQDGTVLVWEFKLGGDGEYFWEFYIEDESTSLWEVKITADTGDEIEIELKEAVD